MTDEEIRKLVYEPYDAEKMFEQETEAYENLSKKAHKSYDSFVEAIEKGEMKFTKKMSEEELKEFTERLKNYAGK